MLNTWDRKLRLDLYTGPYLCAQCDNVLFSGWEDHFSRRVWLNLLRANLQWTHERSLKFLVSLGYRYAIHFLATSPIEFRRPYYVYLRDLMERALRDPSQIGTSLYIYPYVHQPILKDCQLLAGVNHLLNLGVNGQALPGEVGLSDALVIMRPKILLLFCDRDLRRSPGNEMRLPQALIPGRLFDAQHSNTDMPQFMKVVLNRWIGQGQAHQKSVGRWKIAYGRDRIQNPQKVCYTATDQDRELLLWQRANCP
jgi:hypothetical protein